MSLELFFVTIFFFQFFLFCISLVNICILKRNSFNQVSTKFHENNFGSFFINVYITLSIIFTVDASLSTTDDWIIDTINLLGVTLYMCHLASHFVSKWLIVLYWNILEGGRPCFNLMHLNQIRLASPTRIMRQSHTMSKKNMVQQFTYNLSYTLYYYYM